MKLSRFLFYSFLFLLILSCTQNVKSNRVNDSEEKLVTEAHVDLDDATDTTLELAEEEFYAFLNKFSEQRSFQLNRIKFPINVTVPDADHEGMAPMEETIGRYEWDMLDLTYDSTFLTRPYDQYYQVVRFRNDTAVVQLRGIDNGIYADYFFKIIDNQWFLVTLYEASF